MRKGVKGPKGNETRSCLPFYVVYKKRNGEKRKIKKQCT